MVAHLNREPKDDRERLQIERHKRGFREAFERMAKKELPRSYEEIRAEYRARPEYRRHRRAGEEVEPEPLPPLPPGKARIVSF